MAYRERSEILAEEAAKAPDVASWKRPQAWIDEAAGQSNGEAATDDAITMSGSNIMAVADYYAHKYQAPDVVSAVSGQVAYRLVRRSAISGHYVERPLASKLVHYIANKAVTSAFQELKPRGRVTITDSDMSLEDVIVAIGKAETITAPDVVERREALRELLQALIKTVTPDVVRAIVRRSEGLEISKAEERKLERFRLAYSYERNTATFKRIDGKVTYAKRKSVARPKPKTFNAATDFDNGRYLNVAGRGETFNGIEAGCVGLSPIYARYLR